MSLISGCQLTTLKRALCIIDTFWSLPYKWCSAFQSFTLLPNRRLASNKLRLVCGYIYFFFIIFQTMQTWPQNSTLVKTYCVMTLAVYTMMLSGSQLNYQNPALIIGLLNNMISFEKRHRNLITKNSAQSYHPLIKALVIYNALSIFWPVSYFFNIVLNPCMPIYAGSYLLLNQCNASAMGNPPDSLTTQLGTKIFVAGISVFTWEYLMPGMVVHLCLMFIQGISFSTYICSYARYVTKLHTIVLS